MKIIQNTNKRALKVASISFLLGSAILTLYLVSKSEPFLIGGIFYVTIALALNTITLIDLIINSIINYQYYQENLITILVFLANIPIALGYILLVINTPS